MFCVHNITETVIFCTQNTTFRKTSLYRISDDLQRKDLTNGKR